jgi:hypothetical protein
VTAVSLLAVVAGVSFAAVAGSAAASCRATVAVSGPRNGHLVLTPATAKVRVRECLAFSNSTSSPVNIAITKDGVTVYRSTVRHGVTTAAKASYTPKTAGRASIVVDSRVLLLKFTGTGSATVAPAPKDSPSASESPTPHGHESAKPAHTPSKTPSPHKPRKPHSPRPHATGFKLPPLPPLPSVGRSALPKGSSPVVAPGLTSLAPVTTTSATPVAVVVAGPLETAEDTSRGLPIAVAVLVVLGLASGYGRVLLAAPKPVDNRRDGAHRG